MARPTPDSLTGSAPAVAPPAIAASGIGKCYHIYDRPQDRLKQIAMLDRVRFHRDFWALRNVHLEVARGETVGIVGSNGSGKSTLLQIIAGTTPPTEGEAVTRGRITAMLELGTGFNPEFTGRENAMLNGAVHGIGSSAMRARMADIEAFANIGAFIDQPIKTYSSGMVARLAFAVAINTDPDILIIDEILSVGDERFQRKCFTFIDRFKAAGGTILFVSHSAQSVLELCDRAVLLDRGEVVTTGTPKTVIDTYHRRLFGADGGDTDAADGRAAAAERADAGGASRTVPGGRVIGTFHRPRPGGDARPYLDDSLADETGTYYDSNGARIEAPAIRTPAGEPVNVLVRGDEYVFGYRVAFERAARNVRFTMLVRSTNGVELAGLRSHPDGAGLAHVAAGSVLDVAFRFRASFLPGVYFLNAGVVAMQDGEATFLHRGIDVAAFRIRPEKVSELGGHVDISTDGHCTVTDVTPDRAAKAPR